MTDGAQRQDISEMAQLQSRRTRRQAEAAREVASRRTALSTRELDAAHDQLDREHKNLTSEAAMPELPDPSLAWEDLSSLIGAH